MCIIYFLQLILKLNNQERFRSWLEAAKVATFSTWQHCVDVVKFWDQLLQEECEWTLNSLLIEPIQVRLPFFDSRKTRMMLHFSAEDSAIWITAERPVEIHCCGKKRGLEGEKYCVDFCWDLQNSQNSLRDHPFLVQRFKGFNALQAKQE